jgi:3-dehydroquinate dehydratase-2
MKILLINGPNLNLLGTREPEKYGSVTLQDIETELKTIAQNNGAELDCFQSNHEGDIIDKIHSSKGGYQGIIINAGGLTHTSVSLRDAISSVDIPTVEVHMTNIHAREEFRHTSLISGVSIAQVVGFGKNSYKFALEGLIDKLKNI